MKGKSREVQDQVLLAILVTAMVFISFLPYFYLVG